MNRQARRAAAKQSQTVAPQNLEAVKQSLEAAKQGKVLFDLGRYAEALECFNAFARINPNVAALYQTRGLCLQRLGRLEEAQADFERSIALNPTEAETHKNLGTLHSRLGRMEQALASIDRALALRPNFTAALNEKARALWSLQALDEAFAAFHTSLAVDPRNADTIWNLALLQLLTGDFERGWRGREARWKASSLGLADRGFSQGPWLRDQPIEGKTILLHADEGLGDSIQFARYVPILAALGARVILEVPPPVQHLLGGITGVTNCADRSAATSLPFDLHCPLGSLPLAFGTRLDTIPFAQGYLPAPPAERVKAWEDRLGPHDRFRVGLVWSGNPDHKNDHNRSMALRTLAPLLDCDDVQFVSLQKGARDQDRALLGERPDIVDLTEQLTDFTETAALISCLDLVISVDTSVVHLAGALGAPVWTMLPFNPDWRWLLKRDDSPWYSSMRLFRQPRRDDWASVVDSVRRELEALVSAWRSGARQTKALPPKAEDALLANYLGYQHWQLGRMDEAVLHFRQALQLNPQYLEAASNCGKLLVDLGRYAEALECLDAAAKLNPNSAVLYQMRGVCLQEATRFEEAEADYNKSIALDSGLPETHNNLGLLHARLGRAEQALACFDRALALRPEFAAALSNKAWSLLDLQLLDDAFAAFRRSLAIEPNHAPTIYNLALLQLLTEDFERGWLGREARWKASSLLADRGFSQVPWLREQPIEGKTILLHADEGMGDSIQFARYVPILAALGARVILEVQPPIQELLAGVPGVANCTARSSATSLPFDLHCPLGSLPLAFGTRLDTIPFAQGYLPAPPAERVKAWDDRLGPHNRFRVGLVWSGNPDHKNDHNRSMALRALAPLLDCADVQFVSLQKGVRDQDRAFLAERPEIVDLTEQLTDFSETAALVSCLDLVISVDTSIVHLAGALGAPVWTMLPFNPDWRWLLNRDDSPWYQSMRLFRQPKGGDWASVVDNVRHELEALASAWRSGARQTKALPPKAEDALLSNYLGYQHWQLGRTDEALLHYRQALKLNPQYLEAATDCGRLLLELGRHADALDCFDTAVKLNPNSAALYQIRGICLQEANRLAEAAADYEKSIALDPALPETHSNLGLLHWRLGRTEQALASIDRALELRPDFAAALSNKAWILLDLQRLDEAFATLDRSLALEPNRAPTIFNFALLQLLTGDFERGWVGREARPSLGAVNRGFSSPAWLGDQPIEGKTIMLYADEGLGDSIQFARYVPMVAALGARVILGVQPSLQQLLSGVTGVATCVGQSSPMALSFDLHCALGSLPRAFGTRLDTIPFAEGYLPAPPTERVKAWDNRLGPRDRFRVGLVWAGNPDHTNDHNRSMALRTLAPLLECSDVQFVSLQKGVRDQDKAFLGERSDIVDLTAQLTDFCETAALVSCLDLVISVDTSVVHLAGALGVPVWTMLPFSPDWRWLLKRDDSPWYSSMRLFRQSAPREWSDVVERLRTELRNVVAGWSPAKRTIDAD